MTNTLSLRSRLILVILTPLLAIAALFGGWAYYDAQLRAAERFDRSLLSTALAISRDTAVSGGDFLSEQTRDQLRDTSGGAVFYHVYAPDGVFVTGYATPPVAPITAPTADGQTYFEAIYQRAPVRVLRFTQIMSIDGVAGPFTFSVWQNTDLRDGFVRGRTRPVFLIIASMIGALALIVWFGVRLGLYPLINLENAIARRSASDLSPIRRAIPVEVSGIVGRINSLLDELKRTLDVKDVFISDAAHQLRNPIASVLALAESVQAAKTPDVLRTRSDDLIQAARETAVLANDLLTLERARAAPRKEALRRFAAIPIIRDLVEKFGKTANATQVKFTNDIPEFAAELNGDPVLFEQAILNILNNSLAHGGATLSEVCLSVSIRTNTLIIVVHDDGKGIEPVSFDRALARFSQITPTSGSGLGLPIAQAITEAFGGQIELTSSGHTFAVEMQFRLPDQQV
jgi:two-component system sensor histidine kinase TctE